ncbi:hypothetical protein GUJ93_ZPchr0010g9769 [Zizania palustris]|uniref:Uncharacterized protein n=1 Tax=Zizania palustris TaxID=103762 RepID=A0A8J6BIP5_ZIZPA|nr:hypothetical protein GUJ93_ZPchr0010g9769 [Zizania palustris]
MPARSLSSTLASRRRLLWLPRSTKQRHLCDYPLLAAYGSPFAGAASTATPVPFVIGPYFVPFLLPGSSSSVRLVTGELYVSSPNALADLNTLDLLLAWNRRERGR